MLKTYRSAFVTIFRSYWDSERSGTVHDLGLHASSMKNLYRGQTLHIEHVVTKSLVFAEEILDAKATKLITSE